MRAVLLLALTVLGEEEGITNTIQQVWPTVVLHTSLQEGAGEKFDEWRRHLADVAERGFQRYLTEILPVELKLDQDFAKEFQLADESRWNLGFFRWQKRAYSLAHKISVQEVLWDGKAVPSLPGVSYRWDQLYKGSVMQGILQRLHRHLVSYKKASEASIELDRKRSVRFIPWVEAYRPGEFQHPHTHTGSPLVGMIALRCGFQKQRIVIEDPRGINPPFGRKWSHDFKQGDLILFPSWTSHFMDPNRHNETNVFLSFALQNQAGVHDFDWEDDGIGSLVKTVHKTIRATSKKKKKSERAEL